MSAPTGSPIAWTIVAIVSILAIAVALVVWVARSSESPDLAGRTATAELRLMSPTFGAPGIVRPVVTTPIWVPTSVERGSIVTVGVSVGDEVTPGARLVEISGRPVFVMSGDAPLFRTLRPGMTGQDVLALQAALAELGYSITDDDVFGAATVAAITAFYEAAGYQPVAASTTFDADLAAAERSVTEARSVVSAARARYESIADETTTSRIAAADAAVRRAEASLAKASAAQVTDVAIAKSELNVAIANQTEVQSRPDVTPDQWNQVNLEVSRRDAAYHEAVRDTDAAVTAAKDGLQVAQLRRQDADNDGVATAALQAVTDAEGGLASALAAVAALRAVNGPTVPQGEIVIATAWPLRVVATSATIEPTAPVVSLGTGDVQVETRVDANQIDSVETGTAVELRDRVTDISYPGTVTWVDPQSIDVGEGVQAHAVTIAPEDELPHAPGEALRVTLASGPIELLVVPIDAVTSSLDGPSTVTVIDGDGERIDVAVRIGPRDGDIVAVVPVVPETLVEGDVVLLGH